MLYPVNLKQIAFGWFLQIVIYNLLQTVPKFFISTDSQNYGFMKNGPLALYNVQNFTVPLLVFSILSPCVACETAEIFKNTIIKKK